MDFDCNNTLIARNNGTDTNLQPTLPMYLIIPSIIVYISGIIICYNQRDNNENIIVNIRDSQVDIAKKDNKNKYFNVEKLYSKPLYISVLLWMSMLVCLSILILSGILLFKIGAIVSYVLIIFVFYFPYSSRVKRNIKISFED